MNFLLIITFDVHKSSESISSPGLEQVLSSFLQQRKTTFISNIAFNIHLFRMIANRATEENFCLPVISLLEQINNRKNEKCFLERDNRV